MLRSKTRFRAEVIVEALYCIAATRNRVSCASSVPNRIWYGEKNSEIEMLKQNNRINPCFQSAVEKCYASYEIARKAWDKKMTIEDESRKADMEMTLAFSLSFSAINIKRANQCYE